MCSFCIEVFYGGFGDLDPCSGCLTQVFVMAFEYLVMFCTTLNQLIVVGWEFVFVISIKDSRVSRGFVILSADSSTYYIFDSNNLVFLGCFGDVILLEDPYAQIISASTAALRRITAKNSFSGVLKRVFYCGLDIHQNENGFARFSKGLKKLNADVHLNFSGSSVAGPTVRLLKPFHELFADFQDFQVEALEKFLEETSILLVTLSNNTPRSHNRFEPHPMVAEAWDVLRHSLVFFRGQPVGTFAALDASEEKANYNQILVRDFVPSELAFLMNREPKIVNNFILKTLCLQSWERKTNRFQLGEGVMQVSFKVLHDPVRDTKTLMDDFGESAITRVALVNSGFWWIILLRAYTKYTGDASLADMPECQKGMRLILSLFLSKGFDTLPTVLCAEGCSVIDHKMGVYGYPIEIQALFFMALRCALVLLKQDAEGKEFVKRIDKHLHALSYHMRNCFWQDLKQLNDIYRNKTEEYSHTAVNIFNIMSDSLLEWIFDFRPVHGNYFVGNIVPSNIIVRWFCLGNCTAILSSLATPEQSSAIMYLIESRWQELVGEMSLNVCYPAIEGHEWRIVRGCDPKNTRSSYDNGGSWPVLLWILTTACIKTGRPQIARYAEKEKLVKLLLSSKMRRDNEISVIPIVSMGGMGKTTLSQIGYNDARVDKNFEMKAFDVMRATKSILETISECTCSGSDLNQTHDILEKQLNGRKFLLGLDDIWNENYDPWDTLLAPFKTGATGSKIIVTSRSQNAESIMKTSPDAINLPQLSGKKIVRRSKVLPLAAKSLGGLLRSKFRVEEWDEVLFKALRDSSMAGYMSSKKTMEIYPENAITEELRKRDKAENDIPSFSSLMTVTKYMFQIPHGTRMNHGSSLVLLMTIPFKSAKSPRALTVMMVICNPYILQAFISSSSSWV